MAQSSIRRVARLDCAPYGVVTLLPAAREGHLPSP
jgi:hypothetical protein